MAFSNAKKNRLKQVREGKRDPGLQRGHWFGINPIQRTTPSFVERHIKANNKHKGKKGESYHNDRSFLIKAMEVHVPLHKPYPLLSDKCIISNGRHI